MSASTNVHEGKYRKFHVSIKIETALEMLGRGENVFDNHPLDAFNALMKAKEKGHAFFTGCDLVTSEGRCAGHEYPPSVGV